MVLRYRHRLERIIAAADQFEPDAVYSSQQHYDCRAASKVATSLGLPRIVHLHYTVGPWLRRVVLKQLRTTDRVVAVSDFVRRQAISHGVPEHRVTTIHNTIPEYVRPDAGTTEQLRRELGLADDRYVFGLVGRFDPGKGHLDAIAAFERVARQRDDVSLVLVGTGRIESKIRTRARHSPVARPHHRRRANGRTCRSCSRYSTRSCIPPPRIRARWPCSRRWRQRLPVVAYDDGGLPELVESGASGLLVGHGDVGALADAMLALRDDGAMGCELGAARRGGWPRISRPKTPARRSPTSSPRCPDPLARARGVKSRGRVATVTAATSRWPRASERRQKETLVEAICSRRSRHSCSLGCRDCCLRRAVPLAGHPRRVPRWYSNATFDTSADFYDRFDYGYSGLSPLRHRRRAERRHPSSTATTTMRARTRHRPDRRASAANGDQLDYSQVFWHCAPGGDPAKGHVMTGVDTVGYNIAWFSPKPMFTNVTKVCWDINLTDDVEPRKWTQVLFVSADDATRYPVGTYNGDQPIAASAGSTSATPHRSSGRTGRSTDHPRGRHARRVEDRGRNGRLVPGPGQLDHAVRGPGPDPASPTRPPATRTASRTSPTTSCAHPGHARRHPHASTCPGRSPGPRPGRVRGRQLRPAQGRAVRPNVLTWHWDNIQVHADTARRRCAQVPATTGAVAQAAAHGKPHRPPTDVSTATADAPDASLRRSSLAGGLGLVVAALVAVAVVRRRGRSGDASLSPKSNDLGHD